MVKHCKALWISRKVTWKADSMPSVVRLQAWVLPTLFTKIWSLTTSHHQSGLRARQQVRPCKAISTFCNKISFSIWNNLNQVEVLQLSEVRIDMNIVEFHSYSLHFNWICWKRVTIFERSQLDWAFESMKLLKAAVLGVVRSYALNISPCEEQAKRKDKINQSPNELQKHVQSFSKSKAIGHVVCIVCLCPLKRQLCRLHEPSLSAKERTESKESISKGQTWAPPSQREKNRYMARHLLHMLNIYTSYAILCHIDTVDTPSQTNHRSYPRSPWLHGHHKPTCT